MPNSISAATVADPLDYLPAPAAEEASSPVATALGLPKAPIESGGVAEFPVQLLVALAAKGFVILTGPSGTGKSRVALRAASDVEKLSGASPGAPGASIAFVPVGADWTDMRPVLGARNPFGKTRQNAEGEQTNETYHVTAALRTILRAADPLRAAMPHFLILDEMNLAHVERYFSAFLSLMEARRSAAVGDSAIPLLLPEVVSLIAEVLQAEDASSLEAIAAVQIDQAGRGLTLPQNLFVIGTVNVDETTYMFSPKVLDRAHVIELVPKSPADYLDNINTGDGQAVAPEVALKVLSTAMDLQRSGRVDGLHPVALLKSAEETFGLPGDLIPSISEATRRLLQGAFKLLDPIGFSFGYRTVNEVYSYMYFWLLTERLLRGESGNYLAWPSALDRAFVQKVLPKLHGSRRQLGGSLVALGAFLSGTHGNGNPPARYRLGDATEVRIEESEALPPEIGAAMVLSRAKLVRMSEQLAALGYVSFVQ